MKSHEIRTKTLENIKNDLHAAEENLNTVRFQLVTTQLENSSLLKRAKKEVARLKTIIREHELGIHRLNEPVKTAEGEDK